MMIKIAIRCNANAFDNYEVDKLHIISNNCLGIEIPARGPTVDQIQHAMEDKGH